MKKIAIIANGSWYLKNFRENFLKELVKNYEVIALVSDMDYSQELKSFGLNIELYDLNRKGLNPIQDFKTLVQLVRKLIKIKPDLVINYTIKPNIYGGIAATLLRIPYINNITGLGTAFLGSKLLYYFTLFLYAISHRFCFKIIFQNKTDLELLTSKNAVPSDRACLIEGSGVDIEKFCPQSRSMEYDFLMISRIIADKGVQEYFDAALQIKNQNSNVSFALLGEVDEGNRGALSKDELRKYSHINFLGHQKNVPEIISKSGCVVLPSYREGLSRTLIEAGACGKIAITTDVPGCRDVVVDNWNGHLCKPKDAISLKECMEKVLRLSNEEKSKMEDNARKNVVDKFSTQIIINKTLKIISDFFKHKGKH